MKMESKKPFINRKLCRILDFIAVIIDPSPSTGIYRAF